jgi:hypothetical protein
MDLKTQAKDIAALGQTQVVDALIRILTSRQKSLFAKTEAKSVADLSVDYSEPGYEFAFKVTRDLERF